MAPRPTAGRRPDDPALVSLLHDAALAAHGSRGGNAALVARLRAAMVAIDLDAGRRLEFESMLDDWRAVLRQQGAILREEADTLVRRIGLLGASPDRGAAAATSRARYRMQVVRLTLARVERLLSLKSDAMADDLLPFGTPVRIRFDTFATVESVPGPRPAAGAEGVVVGYRSLSDRPLAVAIARTVPDDRGGVLQFGADVPWTFDVSATDVDVTGPAMLVGAGPSEAFGYIPTHARADGRDEMLIDAHGLVWRVVPGGERGSAFKAAYPDETALSWLSRIAYPAAPTP